MKSTLKQKTFQSNDKDVYQIITDKIISRLGDGCIPWKKSWRSPVPASNYITKKPYRGINALLLNFFSEYEIPYFLTFKQANELGGKVKKGSKAETVSYWNMSYVNKENGEKISYDIAKLLPEDQVKRTGFLKTFNVFNVCHIEGIDFVFPEYAFKNQEEKIEACENIINQYPNKPVYTFGGDQACYISSCDKIKMPSISLFNSIESYYSVFFHEIIHSTGHASRLNRKGITADHVFGSSDYSKEELAAELGSAFLCGLTQILPHTVENSAAYIKGWLTVLKNDKKFIAEAAIKAQQAVDYILNYSPLDFHEEENYSKELQN